VSKIVYAKPEIENCTFLGSILFIQKKWNYFQCSEDCSETLKGFMETLMLLHFHVLYCPEGNAAAAAEVFD